MICPRRFERKLFKQRMVQVRQFQKTDIGRCLEEVFEHGKKSHDYKTRKNAAGYTPHTVLYEKVHIHAVYQAYTDYSDKLGYTDQKTRPQYLCAAACVFYRVHTDDASHHQDQHHLDLASYQ